MRTMDNLSNWPPTWSTLLFLPALFVGFTVHELAHAMVALLLGDTSQVERKRLSFNPLRHVSWLGMAVFLLIGIGWAKPVWVDSTRFRLKSPAVGMFLVAIAGPMANALTAMLAFIGIVITMLVVWILSGTSWLEVLEFLAVEQPGPDAQGMAVALTNYMVTVNLLLAFFNMLPLPSLDGYQALMSLYSLGRSSLKRRPVATSIRKAIGDATANEVPVQSPAQIHFDIGLAYHQSEQVDEAIARYRQALAHDEHFALAYYNQGLAYWAKGRFPLAASAFRAAMRASIDPGLRTQASRYLYELAQVEQDPEVQLRSAPPPLEPGISAEAATGGAPPLDPAMVRRVWLHLAIGGTLSLLLAILMWLFVTAVTLVSVT